MVTRDIVQRLLNVINDTRRRVNTLESREYVLLNATQTLTNKTLTTPTIGDFTNAQHSHANAAGGGQLSLTTAVSGVLPAANGGTGVNNATRTLTISTNSGTLAFSGAGFTLTIPKTGTVPVGTGTAGRIAEWVTDANTVQASTLAKTGAGVLTLSAAADYTLTAPATGTVALLGTTNVFTAAQTVQPSSDSTAAVAVNNSGGARVLAVDTTNRRIGINTSTPGYILDVKGVPSGAVALGAFGQGNSGTYDGTIPSGYPAGMVIQPFYDFSGNTSGFFGAYAFAGANVRSGVTLSNLYGMFVETPTLTGTGTITNAYGLYVNAPTIGTNNTAAYIGGLLDVAHDTLRLRTARTPASAGASGNAGDICWDSSYLYICTATNTWRRAAHGSW